MTAVAEARRETTPGPRTKQNKISARARWVRRAPLLPALIFTIVVTQVPFIVTLILSSLQWNVLTPGNKSFLGLGNYESFAGLKNYRTVVTDDRMRNAVLNTVVLTASVVLISVVLGLGLAVLLDRRFPGRGLARTLLIDRKSTRL